MHIECRYSLDERESTRLTDQGCTFGRIVWRYRHRYKAQVIISDSDALVRLCRELEGGACVGVDTEFHRERTYLATLCLVQLAGAGRVVAVDALAPGMDLTPLFRLLENPGVVKIFHAPDQDIALLLQVSGTVPAPVFDTQVAAALCGFGDQPAYATLVKRICGVAIDKGSQRTDWTRRPIDAARLQYALADVEHLGVLYRYLNHALDRLGRSAWAAEEMAALSGKDRYRVVDLDQWRRIRIRHPTRRVLAILRALAAWRESEARRRNLPRAWIARDEVLIDITTALPRDAKALTSVPGVSAKFAAGRRGAAVLEAIRRGLEVDEDQCPELSARSRLGDREALLEALRSRLRERCETLQIPTRLVATRDELERIAADEGPALRALSGWRAEVFGDEALALTCAPGIARAPVRNAGGSRAAG